MGEKETAAGAGSALRPGDPIPDIDVAPGESGESRYGGAQFAGGGMASQRLTQAGTADPSPAEARKSDHIYQHNESDLQ